MIANDLLQIWFVISFLVTPGENTGDVLFINPPNTYYQFVDRSIIYDCSHSQHQAIEFSWIVNGTSILMSSLSFQVMSTDLDFSQLLIHNVTSKFNNTEIQCTATLLNGQLVSSEVGKFELQGKLKKVGNLQFSIEEFALYISWSPPYSFNVSGSTQISYLVRRYNLTLSNSTADENTTKGTTYTITNNNSSRRLGCDDINVTVIPENPVDLGEPSTISLIYDFPQVMNHTFRLNSYGYCDFILILDAPICQVGYYKLNENENRAYRFVYNFDNFMLLNATKNEYWYSFDLELKPLLPYQLNLLIFSRNYSKEWHFDIGTNKEFCGTNASFFTSTSSIEIQNRQGPGLIVGVAVGAVAIILGIIGCLIIIAQFRRLQSCFMKSSEVSDSSLNVSVMQQTQHKVEHELKDRPNYQPNNVLENHQPNNSPERYRPNNVLNEHQPNNVPEEHQAHNEIHVSKFYEYMNEEDEKIQDQFKVLYDGSDKSKSIGFSQKFQRLNRVSNITVYDDNRIELMSLSRQENQDLFINASYIDGYNKPKKFIATQDPFDDETAELFWHMIYQEKAPVIVMLSKFDEEADTSCKRYYPLTSNIKYGSMEVIFIKKEEFPKYVHRTLQVKVVKGSEPPFEVHQFNFTAWPSDGVPEYGIPLLKFYHEMQNYCNGDKTPIVVHCRDGVGATGVFISMSNIFEQIKNECVIDVVGTVTTIRHQRMAMVQTLKEYEFLHDLIREHLLFRGTEITVKEFQTQLLKYKERDAQGKDNFELQFNALQLVSKELNKTSKCSVAIKYPNKNRCMDNIPVDKHRVIIEGEEEDYIHASFVNGYKKKKAYIIAENPMESTAENVLKVIYQEKCSIIVTLCYEAEGRPENSYEYWPKLRNFKQVGDVAVEVIEENYRNGFIVRKMIILKDGFPHTLYQYHINCWQPDGTCWRIESISDVLHLLDEKQVNSPIFIHCSDTITQSGIFCALAIICKRLRAGRKKFNVSQVVRSVRIHKPGAVPKLSHYKMIFNVLQIYLRPSSYSSTSSYNPMSLFK